MSRRLFFIPKQAAPGRVDRNVRDQPIKFNWQALCTCNDEEKVWQFHA